MARVRAIVVVLACSCVWPIDQAFGDMTLTLSGQPGSPLVAFSLAGTSTTISGFLFGGLFTGDYRMLPNNGYSHSAIRSISLPAISSH